MSKQTTKDQIIAALARLVADKGFKGVGINALAREAGVDKVLIYRYFESLPMLLRVFAKQKEFWPAFTDLLGVDTLGIADHDTGELITSFFKAHLRELGKRPATQAIMSWGLVEKNELSEALNEAHEEMARDLHDLTPEELRGVPNVDVPAALVLIYAGINCLLLQSKNLPVYAGIDLQTEDGWHRIENGIETLVSAFMNYCKAMKAS
jgi:AcrR family transcriptional regulator